MMTSLDEKSTVTKKQVAGLGLLLRIVDMEADSHKHCFIESADGEIVTYSDARDMLACMIGELIHVAS